MTQKTKPTADEIVSRIVTNASNLEGRTSKLNDCQEKIGMHLLRKVSEKVELMGLKRNHKIIIMNEVYSHFNRAYDNLRSKLREEISEGVERAVPYLQKMLIASEQYLEEITAKRQEVNTKKTPEDIHPKVIEVMDERESESYASQL